MVGDLATTPTVCARGRQRYPARPGQPVVYDLSPPLANRFCHITYSPSVQDWLIGTAARWKATSTRAVVTSNERRSHLASVMGFINHRPDLLDKMPDNPGTRRRVAVTAHLDDAGRRAGLPAGR